MNICRRLVASILFFSCLLYPLMSRVQGQTLREGADDRGFFIGAAVNMNPFRNEAQYVNTLQREFNMIVAENATKFDAIHPAQNTYNFTDTDALVSFAQANNMQMRGHTLIWHNQVPGWVTNGNFTRDQMIEIMRDHIMTVVGRYRGIITSWDVVNEAIDDSANMRNSVWMQRIGPEYIRMAFEFARQADPNATLYYNDYSIEGMNAKSNAVFTLVSNLVNQGVPIDGVGWQMHQINPFTVPTAFQQNAQRLAALGLEISMTETDVRISLPTSADELQQQADGYRSALNFCLNTSNCRAFLTWGFTDKYSWVPGTFQGQGDALIFDANYQPKPAYNALLDVLGGGGGQPQPPPTPGGLTASAGNGQVTLSWSAAAGATSYNIKRATTTGGPYTTIATAAGTSFTNIGLTNGTTYFYVVSAVNANGESANSAQVSATPQAPVSNPPPTPAGLTATAGNGQVTLSWGAAAGATSYNIKRATTSGGPYATIGTAAGTSFINTALTNGTTYFYVVSAVNANGESANSAQVSATPQAPTQGGTVTVTSGVAPGSNPWWGELDVRLNHTAPLTALTITITVQRTTGVSGSSQYNNFPGGVLSMTMTNNPTTVVYTYTMAAGQTLAAGSNRLVAAQFGGTGTAHPVNGDTWTVTYTSGGATQTLSGGF